MTALPLIKPRDRDDWVQPALPEQTPTPAAEPRSRVLLAEDDTRVRTVVARALRNHGFEVVEARDGAAALELAAAWTPDIALLDVCMPRLDGLSVVGRLKAEHGAALPCLVFSGIDRPEERVQAFDVGADDFVGQPVHLPELLKRVDAFERTRRAYIEARRANESADRLRLFAAETAALLAHDLNNGLSVATANLQFVEEQVAPDGEVQDALDGTGRALRRMTALVRNFVDIAQFEDAAITPVRSDVDISELLSTAALIHDPHRSPEDASIAIECEDGLTAPVDPVLTERVIHNLLTNATRYVDRGGTIRLSAHLYDDGGGPWLEIGVGNTGAGIPDALRPTLFDKYRTGADGKAQRGMGLYFCRLACEAHGGRIGLEDHPELSTLFQIRVPLADTNDHGPPS